MNLFQKIYKIVSKIPKGKVATYKQIAKLAGTTPRVVGFALHVNKDPENIPCHRIIRIDGTLAKGYAFGGLEKQREKLQKEGISFLDSEKINPTNHLIFIVFLFISILFLSSYPADAAKKPARNASASVAGGPTPTPKKSSTTVKKPVPKPPAKKSQPSKKTLSPKKSTAKSSGSGKITGSDVSVSYKVQGSSLVTTFSNLKSATSISYTLIYSTNGQQEGAIGTIYPKGTNTVSRTLLFGTCSKNVCRYHTNISDVTLEISVKLKSGKTVSNSYSIGL